MDTHCGCLYRSHQSGSYFTGDVGRVIDGACVDRDKLILSTAMDPRVVERYGGDDASGIIGDVRIGDVDDAVLDAEASSQWAMVLLW